MRDDDISAGARHCFGLMRIEDVWRREEVLLMGKPDQLHFLGVTHTGFFQVLAEDAVVFLNEVAAAGFSGVQNFPTVGLIEKALK
jgi:predicted TIM-barrel enzyme